MHRVYNKNYKFICGPIIRSVTARTTTNQVSCWYLREGNITRFSRGKVISHDFARGKLISHDFVGICSYISNHVTSFRPITLLEIFMWSDNIQITTGGNGNIGIYFSRGKLIFPEGRRPEGNINLPREKYIPNISITIRLLFVLSLHMNISPNGEVIDKSDKTNETANDKWDYFSNLQSSLSFEANNLKFWILSQNCAL